MIDKVKTKYQQILSYHKESKHHPNRFAPSAGYMDWDNQPNPFRSYPCERKIFLPLEVEDPHMPFPRIYATGETQDIKKINLHNISKLLELSVALSTWKSFENKRWSLRIYPSSGALYSNEVHLFSIGTPDLEDGVYHYNVYDHSLEQRAVCPSPLRDRENFILLGLSSIQWRESWKYGIRAFRYCQLDTGHILAALWYAARLFGWRLTYLADLEQKETTNLFGLDRVNWQPNEEEDLDLLLMIHSGPDPTINKNNKDLLETIKSFPSAMKVKPVTLEKLSPESLAWPQIKKVIEASQYCADPNPAKEDKKYIYTEKKILPTPDKDAASILRQRRSATDFNPESHITLESLKEILDKTRSRKTNSPFDLGIYPVQINLILFVHRVKGLKPGAYIFLRAQKDMNRLRDEMRESFLWQESGIVDLYLLEEGDASDLARFINCNQKIAQNGALAFSMLARFADNLKKSPWYYRHLYWEAGMIGHILYLHAELHHRRATGIGCFFDDLLHQYLSFKNMEEMNYQSLYHLTLGEAIEDPRIEQSKPYQHRSMIDQ